MSSGIYFATSWTLDSNHYQTLLISNIARAQKQTLKRCLDMQIDLPGLPKLYCTQIRFQSQTTSTQVTNIFNLWSKITTVCGGDMPSGNFLNKRTDCTCPLHLGIIGTKQILWILFICCLCYNFYCVGKQRLVSLVT